MCHRDLLLRLYQHLSALRHARNLCAPRLAPDFNTLGILSPDELRLSQILKELLSPAGSHAQGAIFLELFLKRFGLENYLPSIHQVKVSTERPTDRIANKMRRMDICLDFGRAAIAIENKPWGPDQPYQCSDYLAQLTASHPFLYCVIYMPGVDGPPSAGSIPECKRQARERESRFKIISYPLLIDWLKDCRRECQSDRVSFFLSEFADYIQQQFVGVEMAEIQEVVNLALENRETLEAALEISNANYEIRYRLLTQLQQQLTGLMHDGLTLTWGIEFGRTHSDFRVGFPGALYSVCFEFDKTECNGFVYGVAKIAEGLPDLPDVFLCLNDAIGVGVSYSWWPWYQNFPAPYCNWKNAVEPWLDIKSGRMATMIMQKTEAIHAALRNANLLGQLDGLP